jgi:hypothetical protein
MLNLLSRVKNYKIFFSFIYAISFYRAVLYTHSESQYLSKALRALNFGNLSNDWYSNTADAWPLYTFLIKITYLYGSELMLYFYQFTLAALFAYWMVSIYFYLAKRNYVLLTDNIFPIFLLVFFSPLIGFIGINNLLLITIVHLVGFDIQWHIVAGIGNFFLVHEVLYPQVFGVLIIGSIYSFLKNRFFSCIVLLALGVSFHPTYLFIGAFLTISYMAFIAFYERNLLKSFLVGFFTLILILPILTYTYINFQTGDPIISSAANKILINRILQHADPEIWIFSISIILKHLILVLSIFLLYVSNNFKFMIILMIIFLGTLTFTVIQILMQSDFIALLFPWRSYAIIFPISLVVIFLSITELNLVKFIFNKLNSLKSFKFLIFILFIYFFTNGIYNQFYVFKTYKKNDSSSVTKFLKNNNHEKNIYLSKPNEHLAQIMKPYTKSAVFIEDNAIPFRDYEIIEWKKRMDIANEIYSIKTVKKCNKIQSIKDNNLITHVISKQDNSFNRCKNLEPIYEDDFYHVYKVK